MNKFVGDSLITFKIYKIWFYAAIFTTATCSALRIKNTLKRIQKFSYNNIGHMLEFFGNKVKCYSIKQLLSQLALHIKVKMLKTGPLL